MSHSYLPELRTPVDPKEATPIQKVAQCRRDLKRIHEAIRKVRKELPVDPDKADELYRLTGRAATEAEEIADGYLVV